MNLFHAFTDLAKNPLFLILFIFIIGIVIGVITNFFLTKFIARTQYAQNLYPKLFIKYITPLTYLLLPLLIINILLPAFGLQTGDYELLDGLMRSLLVITIAVLIIQVISFSEDYLHTKFNSTLGGDVRSRKVVTQIGFFKKILIGLVIIVAIALILMSFEGARKIGAGLLTSAGIITAIVTFAAQNSISNIWAGLQVAFTQPMRVGDTLIVENENGVVEEITLSYVVLKTWDKRRLILPINYFIQKPFQNWTYSTTDRIGTIFLYVDYSFPVEELRLELKNILETHPLWDKQVMMLQVTNTKEHSMEIRILVSAEDSGIIFNLECDVREKLIGFIQTNYPNYLPKTRLENNLPNNSGSKYI